MSLSFRVLNLVVLTIPRPLHALDPKLMKIAQNWPVCSTFSALRAGQVLTILDPGSYNFLSRFLENEIFKFLYTFLYGAPTVDLLLFGAGYLSFRAGHARNLRFKIVVPN